MNLKYVLTLGLLFLPFFGTSQNKKTYKVNTIAFYNLENLFDYEDDPLTFDNEWTPYGENRWTETAYRAKVNNMAQLIAEIGAEITGTAPALLGVCEAENRRVLEDLVNEPSLLKFDYGIIQFDSPDRRGIDVALLYQKRLFTPTNATAHTLYLYEDHDTSQRIYTRDQLLVSGMLDGEKIYILVNHWPSRRGGEARSRPKRIKAAQLNRHIIDSLFSENPYAKIITMGDFNDDPVNPSIKTYLKTRSHSKKMGIKELYNPMESLFTSGLGTLAWRDSWNLFDQIILSSELLKKDYSGYRFYKAGIYNKPYLANTKGTYKGYPYRSFNNGAFTGGYSDHFPVYVYVIKEKE